MKPITSLALVALALLAPAQLLAIPAWSRSVGTSCSTCHATPTWQLTSPGLDFLRNGHRSDPVKMSEQDQKWENYFSLIWKGRFYRSAKITGVLSLRLHPLVSAIRTHA
jgi:hypothetical protein